MVQIATGGGEGADPEWLLVSTAGTGGNFRGAQPSELSTALALPYTQLAGVIGDIVFNLPTQLAGTATQIALPPPGQLLGVGGEAAAAAVGLNGDGNGGANGGKKNRFLTYLGLTILGLAAAPAIYRAANRPRKGKRHQGQDEIASSLDNASNRATTIISSMAPVLAFPIAYIAIDELENRHIISGPLGDNVQVLMTLMASGQVLSSAMGLAGTVVKAVV